MTGGTGLHQIWMVQKGKRIRNTLLSWPESGLDRSIKICVYTIPGINAKKAGKQPSRLCWADKLSVKYDPWWFYILRAWVSGELHEYRQEAAKDGLVHLSAGHREWHHYFRGLFLELATENTKVQDPGEGDVNGAIFVLFKVGRM